MSFKGQRPGFGRSAASLTFQMVPWQESEAIPRKMGTVSFNLIIKMNRFYLPLTFEMCLLPFLTVINIRNNTWF